MTSAPADRFHAVTVVWGPEFRRLFLEVCLPNQLTQGNLEALPAGSRYRIFTSAADVDTLSRSTLVQRINDQLPVDIVAVAELSAPGDRFDRMTACHRRALAEARESRAALIFLSPYIVMSTGALAAALRRHAGGSRAVVCSGLRVDRDRFLDRLRAIGVPALAPRQLVEAALGCLHPFSEAHMVTAPRTASHPIGVYWGVPARGILARGFYLHPLLVDPVRRDVSPKGTIDANYLVRACPKRDQIHVIDDSDELVIFELSQRDAAVVDRLPGGLSPWRAARALSRCDAHQRSYWMTPIRIHTDTVGAEWADVDASSERFATRAVSLLRVSDPAYALSVRMARVRRDASRLTRAMRKATRPLFGRGVGRRARLAAHSTLKSWQTLRKRAKRVRRRMLAARG